MSRESTVKKPRSAGSATAAPPAAPPAAPASGGALPTEAELLKMPADDYMNDVQLAFFRARLLEMKQQLEENAGATSEHLRENEVVPDPADRATIEEEHALELRARDRERKLMKKIEQSLRRIEDGSYGWCEETGEPIGVARLLARPTATLSVEAQQRRELKQKMYGE
jgi:DnaK suppressor protein